MDQDFNFEHRMYFRNHEPNQWRSENKIDQTFFPLEIEKDEFMRANISVYGIMREEFNSYFKWEQFGHSKIIIIIH